MHFYFTPSDGFLSGEQGSMASQRFTVQYMVSCDRKNSKVLLSLIHHDHEEWRYTQLPVTSFVLRCIELEDSQTHRSSSTGSLYYQSTIAKSSSTKRGI